MLSHKTKGIAALSLVAAALLLAGCGFRPLYGERANSPAATQYMAAVEIAPIPERIGQELQNHLRVRLNPRGMSANTKYRLQTSLREIRTDLAIRDDASATLANLQLIANYTLHDATSNDVLYKGQSRFTASYNLVRSQFANLVAEDDARSRAVEAISDDMRIRLGIYFDRQAQAGK
jgi:LPS-assembly lipoprotein